MLTVPHRPACLSGVLLVLSMASVLVSANAQPAKDVRGLWVQRTSLASAERVTEMVRDASRAGINVLLVQVRGRGEAYYDSSVEPRARDLIQQGPAFDPLRLTIALAHDAGIEVHAWVNVNLISSATTLPASATHVLRRHPEWLMVPEALAATLHDLRPGRRAYVDTLARWTRGASATVEGLFLSPVHPGARAHTTAVVEELVRKYPLDGLHLDYIRYPGDTFDYSRATLDAFRAERLPFATEEERRQFDQSNDPTTWTRRLPESWRAFREERLTSLVSELAATARRLRPAITISAAVLPDPAEARSRKLQPWAEWAASGLLDVVCPMAYTQDALVFRQQMDALSARMRSTPLWVGIGAYRLSTDATAVNVRVARQAGATGVLMYSYEGLREAERSSANSLSALTPVLGENRGSGGR